MKVNCLIVDDEPLAIEVIESYLDKLEGFEIAGRCSNAIDAFELIRTQSIHLVFLDIHMPELSGLDFIKSLQNPPCVIITTAYRDYALDGFDLDVVDYLLKPIHLDRFLQAIDKYRERASMPIVRSGELSDPEYINLHADRKTYRIRLQDILYIESMKDYVKIITAQKKYLVKMTLRRLLAKLPDGKFIQIHRSYIVSLDRIVAFDSTMIEVEHRQLPIGRHYKHAVEKVLMQRR